jgi:outer membrane receptor protein involved in Fe transport
VPSGAPVLQGADGPAYQRARRDPKGLHAGLVGEPGNDDGAPGHHAVVAVNRIRRGQNISGGDRPYTMNVGLQFIKTKLNVTQNNVGAPQPYGASNLDGGDVVTDREFNDYLPSFNMSVDLTDDLKFRVAYSKNMTLLDFEQWGGALTPSYAISNEEGGRFIVKHFENGVELGDLQEVLNSLRQFQQLQVSTSVGNGGEAAHQFSDA